MTETGVKTSYKSALRTGLIMLLVVLAAGSAGLSAARLHWPAWLIAAIAAGAAVISGVIKQFSDAYLKVRTDRIGADAARRDRSAETVAKVSGSRAGLPLIREVTGRAALGIHMAIPLPPGADAALSIDLPSYVPRDKDVDVRAAISRMASTGGFLLLIGDPAAGKTRCAAEAIRALPADWQIYIRSSETSLQQLLDDDVSMARTVVWLDDIHEVLDSDRDSASHVSAATIRRLLLPASRPVIIIATTWRDRYERYSSRPDRHEQDLTADARAVIKMAEPVHIPAAFSDSEWRRALTMAEVDPRLAEAASSQERTLTATLANRNDLIRRWLDNDDALSTAVISATIDARYCGHPEPVPVKIIEAIAPHYLTSQQMPIAADGWLTIALNAACQPIRGTTRPMYRVGRAPGRVDGYHVSDILLEHATAHRAVPAEAIWRDLVSATDDPSTAVAIGRRVLELRLSSLLAYEAFRKAAARNYPRGLFAMGVVLRERGDHEEAEVFYRRAIDAGETDALLNLGNLLREQGDQEEAEVFYRRAIDAGDTKALLNLAILLHERSDEEAEVFYRRAIDAGDTNAVYNFAIFCEERGDHRQAEVFYRRAIDAGDIDALVNLGNLFRERGDHEQAEVFYQRAIDAGDTNALDNLAALHGEPADGDQASTH
jgi:tetratricopeptide (TPR) repeat protein